MADRRSLLAQVHIARKNLALEEDCYRSLLERVTGKESAKALSEKQLQLVIDEFKRLGWKPEKRYQAALSIHPDVRKVFAIWKSLATHLECRGSRSGLRAFVKRMAGVSDPNFLNREQARTVIEALKKMQIRYGVEVYHG